jgi:hypothetical protein
MQKKAMTVRINALDGQTKALSFDAGLIAKDVCAKLALKISLKDHHSFALYQLIDNNLDLEQVISETDIVGDVLYEMEQAAKRGNVSQLFFKKKLFWNAKEDSEDPVEKDLTYYQCVYDVVNERWPVANERDAIKLAALSVHVNYGEFDDAKASGVKQTLMYVFLLFIK